jgi:hypothetical protein
MGTMSVFSDPVLVLLMALAALTVGWWAAAIWWTVRRSNWRYGVLAGVVSAILLLFVALVLAAIFGDSFWPIAFCWALLPPASAWGALKLAARNMVNEP